MAREWNEPWVCVNWYNYRDDDENDREGWALSYKDKDGEKATLVKDYDAEYGMVSDEILAELSAYTELGYEVHIVL